MVKSDSGITSKTLLRMQSVSSQQVTKVPPRFILIIVIKIYCEEFIVIFHSIVKPNLKKPLLPQYVPTAVYVYVYILIRVRPL